MASASTHHAPYFPFHVSSRPRKVRWRRRRQQRRHLLLEPLEQRRVLDGVTGTGLDSLVELIVEDPGLNRRVAGSEIQQAARSADRMNDIIVGAIRATGVGNNDQLNAADVRELNAYIRLHHQQEWVVLHGDDEGDEESGFHLVQNDGATTRLFEGQNAVNTVADGVYHIGFAIERGRFLNEDGDRNASVQTVAYWLGELLREDLEGGQLHNDAVPAYAQADTGTGLDQLVRLIAADAGLNRNVATGEITAGAEAADAMNAYLVEAVVATGAANDGQIDVADLHAVNGYLQQRYQQEWVELHGDDEGDEESGFHLVQGDGATTRIFGGLNAVNTVADGVYHIGFDIVDGRFLNEDGDRNVSVRTAAFWLQTLLADQLADGSLVNDQLLPDAAEIAQAEVFSAPTVVMRQPGDQLEAPHSDALALAQGTVALSFTAEEVDGRRTLFSKDARNYGEGGHLTAFVRNGRVEVRLQSEEASYTLRTRPGTVRPGETYHLAVSFGPQGFRLYLNGEQAAAREDYSGGIQNNQESLAIGANTWARDSRRPDWRAHFFAGTIDGFTVYNRALSGAEVALLGAPAEDGATHGSSGTGLDTLIDVILEDPGLQYRVDAAEIAAAAEAAEAMNVILLEAIRATGVANNGQLNAADLRDVNAYIQEHHYQQWVELHGDDEGDQESGFHLVQNDGATTRMFGSYNAVNTVADGVYHIGLDICDGRFLNEDGDRNVSVQTAAFWLQTLLADQLADGSLANAEVELDVPGSTGTGLDSLVQLITADAGLNRNVASSEIVAAARSADRMNQIILEAVRAIGVANNGQLNAADLRDVNTYIQQHHQQEWIELHGDDEGDQESGFHLVQNDGATTRLYGGRNAVNTVADGIYHVGFDIRDNRFLNEDGDRNASVQSVAHWLGDLLRAELAGGELANPDVDPYAQGTTGAGLDALIDIIAGDPGLNRNVATSEITAGARAADQMNHIILEAIESTGVYDDGEIHAADVRDLNKYIQEHHEQEWIELHGDDEDCEETGFHLVQNDGATTRLFGGRNAVITVADQMYHMGFDIVRDRFLNEDGDRNASVEAVAYRLNELLEASSVDEVFAGWSRGELPS